jgi:phage baseplate assembly protein W
MAVVRSARRINPLDANKNVATIGVALPLDSTNLFQGTPTTREQVKTNLLNLILTEKGERLMHPNYGLGVKNLLFEQGIDTLQLEENIHSQIMIYIPEIELQNTDIATSEDGHTIQIKIAYNIKDSANLPDAIQINISDPFAAYREDTTYYAEGDKTLAGHTTPIEYGGDLVGDNDIVTYNNSIAINNPYEVGF